MTPSQFVFLGLVAAALGTFVLAGRAWLTGRSRAHVPMWRRMIFNLGFLAVAIQVVLFALSWTHIGTDHVLFGRWARMVLPTFLIAAGCVLAGKGAARWWLFTSSSLLFIICFFIVLTV